MQTEQIEQTEQTESMQIEQTESMQAETMQTESHVISILYHGNCIDGFSSAYIAWTVLQTKGPVQMFPISPNQERTWPTSQELSGTEIYLLDISVPQSHRDKWLADGAKSILCIDHHASSIEHWPHDQCPIHTETCAALQTHHHFYPEVPVPGWLLAINRIDLWKDVTEDDRSIREILSIIAHKPVRGNVEEAIAMMTKFIHDMNDWNTVCGYLQHGKQILAQKDAELMQVLQKGKMVFVTPDHVKQWKLTEEWCDRYIFILDNSNVSIDTTEAAHLMFQHHQNVEVFINYRKKTYHGKPLPQYIFSARSKTIDITKGTLLKGHPLSAGAMVLAKPHTPIPFV